MKKILEIKRGDRVPENSRWLKDTIKKENIKTCTQYYPLGDDEYETWDEVVYDVFEVFDGAEYGDQRVRGEDMKDILSKIDWAIDTIRDQLKFGLSDLDAVLSRERRAKGVLIEAKEEITALKEELKRERSCVDEVERQELDEEYPSTRISKMAKLARESQKQRKIEL